MSASAAGKPMRPSTSSPAGAGSRNSASSTTEVGCTGPPTYTGSCSETASRSCGTASPTVMREGRLSTTPIAPSEVCMPISTTLRAKFGSRSAGAASSSWPESDSDTTASVAGSRCRARRALSASDQDQHDQQQAACGREQCDDCEHATVGARVAALRDRLVDRAAPVAPVGDQRQAQRREQDPQHAVEHLRTARDRRYEPARAKADSEGGEPGAPP